MGEDRVLGADPSDVERLIGNPIRDQYQGGPTVLTAISGIEIACWDLIGKACGQPVYKLLGGRARDELPSYANGWYGACRSPEDYATKAQAVVALGYRGMKFDPFGIAWKSGTRWTSSRSSRLCDLGDGIDLMIEVHGRLSVRAVEMGRRLTPYRLAWYENRLRPWTA